MSLLKLPLQGATGDVYVAADSIAVIETKLDGYQSDPIRATYSAVKLKGCEPGSLAYEIAVPPDKLAALVNGGTRDVAVAAEIEFPFHPDVAHFLELAAMWLRSSKSARIEEVYRVAADAIPTTSSCRDPLHGLKPFIEASRSKNGNNADYVGAFEAIGFPRYLAEFFQYCDTDSYSNSAMLAPHLEEVRGYILRRCSR